MPNCLVNYIKFNQAFVFPDFISHNFNFLSSMLQFYFSRELLIYKYSQILVYQQIENYYVYDFLTQ